MRMIDMGSQRGPLHIIDTSTAVDCTKHVGFCLSFRSLIESIIPCCCGLQQPPVPSPTPSSIITITFFGHRRSHVSLSLHVDTRSHPLLLVDLPLPTTRLAHEMRHGLLRIALECTRRASPRSTELYSVPAWAMYCNGRKAGFAVRRQPSVADTKVFELMQSVSVGAGVVPCSGKGDDVVMYLRARFERVVGSVDSESFHMINPVGSSGQELSIFLLRS